MEIADWSDAQLATLARNYARQGRSEGGKFSLSEVLREQYRRKPSPFDTVQVARTILCLAQSSPDKRLSYLDLWRAFRPDKPWAGHGTQTILKNALGRVIGYCAKNKLPVLTVLVVSNSTRRLTEKAIENIFNECRALGMDTGLNAKSFVAQQSAAALAMSPTNLPAD